MAAPALKQYALGNDLLLSPKLLGTNRLIIDVRQFKTYKEGGKKYLTNEGVFLYLSRYARLLSELSSNGEKYFQFNPFVDFDLADLIPAEIDYGGTILPSIHGGVVVTVQSKGGPKSITLLQDQYAEIRRQNDEIEASIETLKYFLCEKQEAEKQTDEEEKKELEEEAVRMMEDWEKKASKKKKLENMSLNQKNNRVMRRIFSYFPLI